MSRGDAGSYGTPGFIAAAGIDVQSLIAEYADDGDVGTGFHGIACRKAECVGKVQCFLRLRLQGVLIVDKHGRTVLFLNASNVFLREER